MKNLDRNKNYLTNKEIIKQQQVSADNTVKCKCGHSVVITNRFGRVLCNWCGQWVYRDSKIKFKYKLMEELNNGKMVYNRKK